MAVIRSAIWGSLDAEGQRMINVAKSSDRQIHDLFVYPVVEKNYELPIKTLWPFVAPYENASYLPNGGIVGKEFLPCRKM